MRAMAMRLRSWLARASAALPLAIAALPAGAYEYSGYRWLTTSMAYYVDIPAAGSNANLWNDAFDQAAGRWKAYTGFDVGVIRAAANPCLDDNRNGVAFQTVLCDGSGFGSETLAVSVTTFIRAQARILETDISFNANESWSVYSGSLRTSQDFRRVATHEIGHGLGFSHEPDVPSIMAPFISNVQVPQATDIQGITDIYGIVPPPLPAPPGLDPNEIAALLAVIHSIIVDD